MKLPEELSRNISDIFGEEGRAWLASIPALESALARTWGFRSARMLPNLTYSYVAEVTTGDGAPAILKLAPKGARTSAEIAWYGCNPVGTPRVLFRDEENGAILLERLAPGYSLKKLVQEGNDDEATLQLASAIRGLKPKPNPAYRFKHVSELGADLDALEGKIERKVLERARAIFCGRTADRSRDLPLHGDIHHDNILRHGDRWLVIDPHGYLGPRAFEAGAMLRNPYDCFPGGNLKEVIHRRLEILAAELPFETAEILDWCFAYTLMAAAWSALDHAEVPREHLEVARLTLDFRK